MLKMEVSVDNLQQWKRITVVIFNSRHLRASYVYSLCEHIRCTAAYFELKILENNCQGHGHYKYPPKSHRHICRMLFILKIVEIRSCILTFFQKV